MSGTPGNPRVALFITEKSLTTQKIPDGYTLLESKLTEYKEFLRNCAFDVKDLVISKEETNLNLNRFLVGARQIIVSVTCSKEYSGCMEQFLQSIDLEHIDPICTKRLLMFCRICNDEADSGDARDVGLTVKFSKPSFRNSGMNTLIIAYKADSLSGTANFYAWLSGAKEREWETQCVSSILESTTDEKLYVCPKKEGASAFKRDVFVSLPQRVIRPSEIDIRVDENAQRNAAIVYPNRRQKKPLALIILNIDKGRGISASVANDFQKLLWLLNTLQYSVVFLQTDAGSNNLENRVSDFANDMDHEKRDSCILVVLSQSDFTMLSGTRVVDLHKHMATGRALRGKPRLIILNEWERRFQPDGEDAVETNAAEILADAVAFMQEAWSISDEKRIHPHSGIVLCHAKSAKPTDTRGSEFIEALRTTVIEAGRKEDVVSMIPLINRRMKEPIPQWCVQTYKLFYLMDTGNISDTHEEISAPNTIRRVEESAPRTAVDRTGFALILTDKPHENVRSYQMFLEYASFEVHAEYHTTGLQSFRTMIHNYKSAIENSLSLLLIVRQRCNDNALAGLVGDLSSFNLTRSLLMIFCDVADVVELEENMENGNLELPQNLPRRFSLAYYKGNQTDIEAFFQDILQTLQRSETLQESPLLGTDFSIPGQRHQYFSNENEPEWRNGRTTWLDILSLNPAVENRHSSIAYATFSMKEMREKWFSVPTPVDAGAVSVHQSRVLVIHNVTFSEKNLGIRFGTHYDSQRSVDCFEKIRYRASLKANLTANGLLSAVKDFANADDHGIFCAVVIISHGCLGQVACSDGSLANESEILKTLNSGKGTANKPTLVVFQTCQFSGSLTTDACHIPGYPGMIVARSTSPEEPSVRNREFGSRFIQSFCTILENFAIKTELATLSSIVNYLTIKLTSDGFSQLPVWFVRTNGPFHHGSHPVSSADTEFDVLSGRVQNLRVANEPQIPGEFLQ